MARLACKGSTVPEFAGGAWGAGVLDVIKLGFGGTARTRIGARAAAFETRGVAFVAQVAFRIVVAPTRLAQVVGQAEAMLALSAGQGAGAGGATGRTVGAAASCGCSPELVRLARAAAAVGLQDVVRRT